HTGTGRSQNTISTVFQRACERLRRRRSWTAESTRRPPSEASAAAQPPPTLAVAFGSSFTTMNPLSCPVVQTSPLVIPPSLGKLGFGAAMSKLRTKVAGTALAYCEPFSACVPFVGGL